MRSCKRRCFPQSQKGFSLVELMVALVLGLLVLAAVSQGYVALKRAFTQVDSIAERQNKIRFLSDAISLDVRASSSSGVKVKVDPDDMFNQRCDVADVSDDDYTNDVVVNGSAIASGAQKTLHIEYSGSRPDDPYCTVVYPELRNVRYFSFKEHGLYMCYRCVDSSGVEDPNADALYKVDSNVDATFSPLGLNTNAVEVSLLFPSDDDVDIEGALAVDREYVFSSVSRQYIVEKLSAAVK